jgi:hypothetical protein
MQPPSSRSRRTTTALGLWLVLVTGCGSSGATTPGPSPDGAARQTDTAAEHPGDGAADAFVLGRCCVMQPGDGSMPLCSGLDNDASLGVSEPCFKANSGGTYGRWACGPGAEAPTCDDNGFSCALGTPCRLVDVGCSGVVQACGAPPPG